MATASRRVDRSVMGGQRRAGVLAWAIIALCAAMTAHANTMDYDLNQAVRTVKDVSAGLERLRPGDVATYNRLSGKLTKAAKHLEATQSKGHEQFEPTARQWQALQAQMAAIAQAWQGAQAEAQAQQQAQAEAAARAQAEAQAAAVARRDAASQPAAGASTAAAAVASTAASSGSQVAPIDLDPLMAKYQRQNLPTLADDATPAQARSWAEAIKALQTTTLQADVATIKRAVDSGAASKADGDRVHRWITDMFQGTITERITQARQARDGALNSMVYVADLIESVGPEDRNGAYRVAGPVHGPNNIARLDAAIAGGAAAAELDAVFGASHPERAALLEKLTAARAKLDRLAPLAAEQAEAFANAPRKQRANKPDFIAPIAQKFWLDGSVIAESDDEGNIWIDANDVADITHNGEIWINSNERGSIEPDGKIWLDGNQVGSLEENGEVWRGGNQVGLIDAEGTAWVNGNPAGTVEPLKGSKQRAAIIYYFGDFFR
ncbi:MAG: hypothetical protein AAGI15_06460 [Pseudomonadota bacterium]